MSLRAAFPASCTALLLLAACGDSPKDLFGPGADAGGALAGGGGGSSGSGGDVGAGGGSSGGITGAGGSAAGGLGGAGSGGFTGAGGDAMGAGGAGSPDAGAGGAAEGGAGGSGVGGSGDGGSGAGGSGAGGSGDGGGGPVAPSDGFVRCDADTCDLGAGEVCCTVTSGIGTTRSQCSQNTLNCTRVFACDNQGDCGVGEQCCLTYSALSLSPNSSCQPAGCEIPVECTGAGDCPSGQTCCGIGETVTGGTLYSSFTCQTAACNGAGDYILCEGGVICPDGTSCEQSSHLPPGYPVCK